MDTRLPAEQPFVNDICGDSLWDEVLAQPTYHPLRHATAVRIQSVNVGLPRTVEWNGRTITTGIFKDPVTGPIHLDWLNLTGDKQADLTVHGGPDKAVYAYDAAHYTTWQQLLTRPDWASGMFGENLTTEGLLESQVRIGDLFQMGTAKLRAVQPRFPCYKLNVRFNDSGMARQFAQVGRPGIYFRVEEPGTIQANDRIELIDAASTDITIQAVFDIILHRKTDIHLAQRIAALPHLPEPLKKQLSQ